MMAKKKNKIIKVNREELDLIVAEEKATTPSEIRKVILPFIRKKKKNMITASDKIVSYFLRKYRILTLSDTGVIFIYNTGVYNPNGMEILSKEIELILIEYCNNHWVNEIIGRLKRITLRNRDTIQEPAERICLLNGILNINTMQIEAHNPDIIFFSKVPVNFIPLTDCPRIKKFLSEIADKEGVILLQEVAGYCLYKCYFIQKAIMLVGGGANGKSTYANLLRVFLGRENVSSVSLQRLTNNRFSVASLFGKLANIHPDLSSKAITESSMFKSLVGEDAVTGEKKFKDEFSFINYAKLIFSANAIPKTPEDNLAYFRRWIILVFQNKFLENANKKILNELTTPEELSGFLNFALEGLKRLLENKDFSFNKSVEEVREQYIRMSDSVGALIMDAILIDPEKYVRKKDLYAIYCDYCRKMKYPIEAENSFHRELQKQIRVEDYRPVKFNDKGERERPQCWKGIYPNRETLTKLGINPDILDKDDLTGGQDSQGSQG